jgi:hypothetical protein
MLSRHFTLLTLAALATTAIAALASPKGQSQAVTCLQWHQLGESAIAQNAPVGFNQGCVYQVNETDAANQQRKQETVYVFRNDVQPSLTVPEKLQDTVQGNLPAQRVVNPNSGIEATLTAAQVRALEHHVQQGQAIKLQQRIYQTLADQKEFATLPGPWVFVNPQGRLCRKLEQNASVCIDSRALSVKQMTDYLASIEL